jgi:hypothetical protein
VLANAVTHTASAYSMRFAAFHPRYIVGVGVNAGRNVRPEFIIYLKIDWQLFSTGLTVSDSTKAT